MSIRKKAKVKKERLIMYCFYEAMEKRAEKAEAQVANLEVRVEEQEAYISGLERIIAMC